MARIQDVTLKNWLDGEIVTATDYKQERSIITTAINDNDNRVSVLENATFGQLTGIRSGIPLPTVGNKEGDLFYLSNTDIIYAYDGSDWKPQARVIDLDNHKNDTNNPHNVTIAQIGALPNTTTVGNLGGLTATEIQNTYAKKSQPSYTPFVLFNSWVNNGNGHYDASYLKDEFGYVDVKGMIKDGATSSGVNLVQLPAGSRPEKSMTIPAACWNGTAWVECTIEINANGYIRLISGNPSILSLNTIPRFKGV